MKIPNCTIGCKVTGKRVNRGAGYDLEIPVSITDLLVPKKQLNGQKRKEHKKSF